MDKELYEAALAARKNAYIPYSHFAVGAAVRTEEGKIFTGCNIENASYGLTICAERNAIFSAVGQGYTKFAELCVVADTPEPVAPCGACRQVIGEFKIPQVCLTNLQGKSRMFTWQELLPYDFAAEVLPK